ncbi:hypothetical protein [Polaromonas sp.]|uniref:hypothetical protein n=1 Tax=Polaromonas sp. TaxID=1869339 RepID=UPI003C93A595
MCTSPRFFIRWAVKRGHREGVGPFDGVVPVPDRMTGYVVLGALLQVPHMYVVMECQQ